MTQVDRLDLLERWECPEHGELTGNWWTTSDDVRRCGHPDCAANLRLEKVVYVPASQLQGAVEALDDAIKAARLFNRNGMTWLEYDRKLVELEQVVNRARGQ